MGAQRYRATEVVGHDVRAGELPVLKQSSERLGL